MCGKRKSACVCVCVFVCVRDEGMRIEECKRIGREVGDGKEVFERRRGKGLMKGTDEK